MIFIVQRQNIDYEIGSYPNFSHKNKTSGVNIVISSWKKDNLSLVGDQIIDMISVLGGKSSIV